ncbi:hypothetical protein M1R55_24375 (plasmid) [Deinococcus sp. QL22]|nr:hypothetical protein [Deinococcus sp. QL22]UQN09173.1 hypothetical protein M1R55_24375 [Deinococcus sp. QL22]
MTLSGAVRWGRDVRQLKGLPHFKRCTQGLPFEPGRTGQGLVDREDAYPTDQQSNLHESRGVKQAEWHAGKSLPVGASSITAPIGLCVGSRGSFDHLQILLEKRDGTRQCQRQVVAEVMVVIGVGEQDMGLLRLLQGPCQDLRKSVRHVGVCRSVVKLQGTSFQVLKKEVR